MAVFPRVTSRKANDILRKANENLDLREELERKANDVLDLRKALLKVVLASEALHANELRKVIDFKDEVAARLSGHAASFLEMMASAEAEAKAAEPLEPSVATATTDPPLRENRPPQENPPPRRSGRNKASKDR